MTNQPAIIWTHDCERCVALGPYYGSLGSAFDLYWCPTGGLGKPTVVARYGSDGPEYTSGLELADIVPSLHEARHRARIAGLME